MLSACAQTFPTLNVEEAMRQMHPFPILERFVQKDILSKDGATVLVKGGTQVIMFTNDFVPKLAAEADKKKDDGDGNGDGGVGAQGVGDKEGAKREEAKHDEAVEATEAETIAERVHRKEVEFMARSAPLVVISLGLSGRSLALPQVKVLAKGITRAVALASLDLRHNPFEHDEEVYDEVG